MGKIVRYEFPGGRIRLSLLFLSGISIGYGMVYLLSCLVPIEEEVASPTEFLEAWKKEHPRWL